MKKYRHEHDDYSVLAYQTHEVVIAGVIESFHTVSLFRAIKAYIKFSHQYPMATIVFRHNRYY